MELKQFKFQFILRSFDP